MSTKGHMFSQTRPGYKLGSEQFEIMFVAGHQLGIGCYLTEYESNWRTIMDVILKTLEVSGKTEGSELVFSLSKILTTYVNKKRTDSESLQMSVVTELCDEPYFLHPSTKSLYITFSDELLTCLHFFVRRKQILQTLKDIGLDQFVNSLQSLKVESKNLPKTVLEDIERENKAWWNCKISRTLSCLHGGMINRDVSWRADQFQPNIVH